MYTPGLSLSLKLNETLLKTMNQQLGTPSHKEPIKLDKFARNMATLARPMLPPKSWYQITSHLLNED